MAETTGNETTNNAKKILLVYHGTTGTEQQAQAKGTNLGLLQKCTKVEGAKQETFGIRGVGARAREMKDNDLKLKDPACSKLYQLISKAGRLWPSITDAWQGAFAGELMTLVADGWAKTARTASQARKEERNNATTQIFVLGMSRGGFEAQMVAHLLDVVGRPLNREHVENVIESICDGTFHVRNMHHRQAEVHGLFVLDPVATHGWMGFTRLLGRSWQDTYCGFDIRTLPANVLAAYVVLQAGENRWPYSVNAYIADAQERLNQLWFQGRHGDANGPSELALDVLAHLYQRMEAHGIRFDDGVLQRELLDIYDYGGRDDDSERPRVPYSVPVMHFSSSWLREDRQFNTGEKLHWSFIEPPPKLGASFEHRECASLDIWECGKDEELERRQSWAVGNRYRVAMADSVHPQI